MNRELEEAGKLNYKKESEISKMMVALDASIVALLEREESVKKRTQ